MMNGTIRIPPDGIGKKIQTMTNIIDGQEVQTQTVALVGANQPEQGQYIDNKGSAYVRFGEGQPALDPYNRLKVVQSHISGVYEFSNDGYDDLFYTLEEGEATYTYNPQLGGVILASGVAANSHVMRTTNRHHYYQVGTAAFVAHTVSCGDSGVEGNTRQWGAFNAENGFGWQLEGTGLSIVIRTAISGTVQEIKIPQSEWNLDKLDGTGLSGYTLDVTKCIRYWCNVSFPGGVGRFGIFIGGERVKCHEIVNINNSYPPMKTISLPITFCNKNTDIVGGSTTLNCFAAVVITEGNPDYTFWRYGGLGCLAKPVTTDTPLFAVKSKLLLETGEDNHIQAYPERLSVFSNGGAVKIDMYWTTSASLTDSTFLIDGGATLLCDNAATAFALEDRWNAGTFYMDSVAQNIDLKSLFELNDEAICISGGHTEGPVLAFVATKLSGESVFVSADLSVRELW